MTFPSSIDQLTPAWLSQVLGADVSSFDVEATGGVSGFVGQALRLRVAHGGGAPDSVIVKLPAENPQSLEYVRMYGLYRTECTFYNEVASSAPVRTARCFHAEVSDDGMRQIIVLEDLGALRQGDQVAGLEANDAEAVARAVARLHAQWWRSPALDTLTWLPTLTGDMNRARQTYAGVLEPLFLERYGDRISARSRALVTAVHHKLGDVLDALSVRSPFTYVHFDARPDNLFFDDRAARTGDHVVLLDWQLSLRGPGALDLAWTFSWALTNDVRRQTLDRILAAYLDELRSGGVTYERAALERDLRESLCVVVAMMIQGGATAPTPDARSKAAIDALVDRVSRTCDELDVLGAIAAIG